MWFLIGKRINFKMINDWNLTSGDMPTERMVVILINRKSFREN